jgi:transcriptional regulator with XRE-family HTH domain
MSTLGQRLKWCRERMGWTQIQVAERIGTSNMNISNYERGTREPDIEMLSKFSELYNVSIQWLITGTNAYPREKDVYNVLEQDDCTYRDVLLQENEKRRIHDFITGMVWDRLREPPH